MLALLAVVEGLALAAPVATRTPVSRADLDLAMMLASLSVTYSLFVNGWEKARRLLLFERTPAMMPNVLGTWCFAAAILLPPVCAAAVTAVSVASGLPAYNAAGMSKVHRYVYSSMTSVLAATLASRAFRVDLPLAAALPIAAATWLLVGAGATTLAMCASGQFGAARVMLHPNSHRLEVTTMAVAILEYALYSVGLPLLVWTSLPIAVGVQRYFTRRELQSREAGARPMERKAWLAIAKVILEATPAATIVRIKTSDPEAARTVAMVQGGCDAIGNLGDDGLAILLPDCPPTQGDAIARRVHVAMMHHKVPCSVASASTPRDGQLLEDLLAVCEAELVLASESSRRPTSSG